MANSPRFAIRICLEHVGGDGGRAPDPPSILVRIAIAGCPLAILDRLARFAT